MTHKISYVFNDETKNKHNWLAEYEYNDSRHASEFPHNNNSFIFTLFCLFSYIVVGMQVFKQFFCMIQ